MPIPPSKSSRPICYALESMPSAGSDSDQPSSPWGRWQGYFWGTEAYQRLVLGQAAQSWCVSHTTVSELWLPLHALTYMIHLPPSTLWIKMNTWPKGNQTFDHKQIARPRSNRWAPSFKSLSWKCRANGYWGMGEVLQGCLWRSWMVALIRPNLWAHRDYQ